MDYNDYRREYVLGGLRQEMLAASPIEQFDRWQQQAIVAGLKDPTAAALATTTPDGELWQRIVLIKGVSDAGFVFYTNYNSNKGKALTASGYASLLFPWNELDRQVTVSGSVSRVDESVSDAYFASRPRDSQLGAWASAQSTAIDSRDALEAAYDAVVERFGDGEIPRPPHWGGFCVAPKQIEFWQGGARRLHDRLRYRLDNGNWHVTRLQP